ncbi:MAG: hypothetical protein R3B37_12575 [Nitrospira sp.]|nr:hypothetical protein [Nitrospira sp.]
MMKSQQLRYGWSHVLACCLVLWLGTGCGPQIRAEGTHRLIPPPDTLVTVWGDNQTVVKTASMWLKMRGLAVVDPSQVQAALQAGSKSIIRVPGEGELLQVADNLGVEQLVLVGLSGDIRAPAIFVRGLEVKSRRISWIGNARYEDYVTSPSSNHIIIATCRALAAAWGTLDTDPDNPCSPAGGPVQPGAGAQHQMDERPKP